MSEASFSENLINAYFDDELNRDERARAEELIASDPRAAEMLDELERQSAALKSIPAFSLGDGFADSILSDPRIVAASKSNNLSTLASNGSSARISGMGGAMAAVASLAALILVTLIIPQFNASDRMAKVATESAAPSFSKNSVSAFDSAGTEAEFNDPMDEPRVSGGLANPLPALQGADDGVPQIAKAFEKQEVVGSAAPRLQKKMDDQNRSTRGVASDRKSDSPPSKRLKTNAFPDELRMEQAKNQSDVRSKKQVRQESSEANGLAMELGSDSDDGIAKFEGKVAGKSGAALRKPLRSAMQTADVPKANSLAAKTLEPSVKLKAAAPPLAPGSLGNLGLGRQQFEEESSQFSGGRNREQMRITRRGAVVPQPTAQLPAIQVFEVELESASSVASVRRVLADNKIQYSSSSIPADLGRDGIGGGGGGIGGGGGGVAKDASLNNEREPGLDEGMIWIVSKPVQMRNVLQGLQPLATIREHSFESPVTQSEAADSLSTAQNDVSKKGIDGIARSTATQSQSHELKYLAEVKKPSGLERDPNAESENKPERLGKNRFRQNNVDKDMSAQMKLLDEKGSTEKSVKKSAKNFGAEAADSKPATRMMRRDKPQESVVKRMPALANSKKIQPMGKSANNAMGLRGRQAKSEHMQHYLLIVRINKQGPPKLAAPARETGSGEAPATGARSDRDD